MSNNKFLFLGSMRAGQELLQFFVLRISDIRLILNVDSMNTCCSNTPKIINDISKEYDNFLEEKQFCPILA